MTGAYGRVNPIHVMLQDGGDIASGAQDHFPTLRYTDDAVYLVLQSATQWDALAHIYHEGKMYNGYGTEAVNSRAPRRTASRQSRTRWSSRGVLLDIARYKGKPLARRAASRIAERRARRLRREAGRRGRRG